MCCVSEHTRVHTHTRAHTRTLPAQGPGVLAEPLGKGEFFHLPPPGRSAWSQVSRPHCWLPPLCSSYKGPTPGGYLVERVVSAPACPCHDHRPCFCNNDDPGLSHLLKRKSQSVAVAPYFN
uniref:Catenin, beta interacting protein 1 n=1 Tax=Pan troglodytes TaxID=9598 RepID=K7DE12_PANTR